MEKPVEGSRQRDQSTEQLLRQSLRTLQHDGVTESCLDAETLAAWTEGALSGAALEAAQLHVADCPRCQDLVGTLARINSSAPQTESVRSSRRWLAWAVPLTAAAAAVALWIALPDRNALVPQSPRDQLQMKSVDKVAPQPAVEPQPAEPAPSRADSRQASSPRQGAALAPIGGARRKEALRQPAVEAGAEKKEAAGADAARDTFLATGAVGGRLEADNSAKTAQPATPAAPAPAPAAAAAPLAAQRAAGRAPSPQRADAAATDIVSPDPSVRWRIVGSAVQHSANGGVNWQAASTGSAAELTAGTAPSTTVCWLVGRDGVVLLTTDGRTWRQVAFPEMTDLSAVFTVDAGGNVASVSTADGRTFVTIDGGLTWTLR